MYRERERLHSHLRVYIYIYIVMYSFVDCLFASGRRLHAGNRDLRDRRGSSAALSYGFAAACSDGSSFVQWRFPEDRHFSSGHSLGFPVAFPMDFHFCELRCAVFCPDSCAGASEEGHRSTCRPSAEGRRSTCHRPRRAGQPSSRRAPRPPRSRTRPGLL